MSEPLKIIAGAPDRPLVISDIEIPCYVLEDETRVLVQRGLATGMGMSNPSGAQIGRFAVSKSISPFISNEMKVVLDNPIRFVISGGIAHGYPATLLVDLCNAVLAAREAGTLQRHQIHIAQRCETLIRGLATIGIIALVDEATGYQEIRAKKALADILEAFIARELQPWTRTFPYEFYKELYRLRGWSGPDGNKRTQQAAKDTNDIIYARVAPGVLEELQELNPMQPNGSRRWRHHQWFKPDPGYIKLNQHIAAVMALMRAAPNWTRFKANLQRAFPKLRDQLEMDV